LPAGNSSRGGLNFEEWPVKTAAIVIAHKHASPRAVMPYGLVCRSGDWFRWMVLRCAKKYGCHLSARRTSFWCGGSHPHLAFW